MLHRLESSSVGPAFGCVVVRARPANSVADDGGFEMITSGYRARVCSPGRLPTRCRAAPVGAARDASRPGAHPMRRPPGAHPMRRPPAVVLGFAASVWSRTSGRASRLLTGARRARPRVRLCSPPVSTRDEPVGVAVIGVLREVGRRPVRRHGTRGGGESRVRSVHRRRGARCCQPVGRLERPPPTGGNRSWGPARGSRCAIYWSRGVRTPIATAAGLGGRDDSSRRRGRRATGP